MKLILAMFAMVVVMVGCQSEGTMNSDFIKSIDNFGGDIGKGVASLGRVHTAFHRMNTPRQIHPSTQDAQGNHYCPGMQINSGSDSRHDLSIASIVEMDQIYRIAIDPEINQRVTTVYATDFGNITAMLWHEGSLHVMHGPHYSVLTGVTTEGIRASRENRSVIDLKRSCTPQPKLTEVQALRATLTDRTKSNELRIEAMWRLRAMSAALTRSSDFDPTKDFITALHNGPDALRAEAAKVLRVSSKDTSPAIKGLIHRAKNDTNAKVRMEAALTLGYLKANVAVVELFGSLDDPDDAARMAKIMAIRSINEWDLAPAFVNAASQRTREGAMLALSDVDDASAIAALDFAVRSSSYSAIRLQSVTLLERASFNVEVRDHDVFLQVLMSENLQASANGAQTDHDLIDKQLAAIALQALPRENQSPQFSQILDALRAAMQDEDESVRTAAQASLHRLDARVKEKTPTNEAGVGR